MVTKDDFSNPCNINEEYLEHYIDVIQKIFGLEKKEAKAYAISLYQGIVSHGGNPDSTEGTEETVKTVVGAWLKASENKK